MLVGGGGQNFTKKGLEISVQTQEKKAESIVTYRVFEKCGNTFLFFNRKREARFGINPVSTHLLVLHEKKLFQHQRTDHEH